MTQSSTMAEQEGGWPLGLQRLNTRVGLTRNLDMFGSLSFSTLLTSSATFASSATTSSSSSFDLDTEEIAGAIHLSIRSFSSSIGGSDGVDCGGFGTPSPPPAQQQQSSNGIKQKKCKPWFYYLCLKPVSDDEDHKCSTPKTTMNPQISLGHLLEEERIRSMGIHRRSGNNVTTCIASKEIMASIY